MYSLPYLCDIRDKIDRKIKDEPDFYDNIRVNGLRKDIVELLRDMRNWVDSKDQNQLLGKNRTYLPVKDAGSNVGDFIQRHSDIVDTAERLGVL